MIIKDNENIVFSGRVSKVERKNIVKNDGKKVSFIRLSSCVGKDKDDSDIWVNSVVWGDLGSNIEQGDLIFATGIVETKEYNGRTYETTKIDFIQRIPKFKKIENNSDNTVAENSLEPVEDDSLPF